jgi:hypothetical protein
MTKKYSETMYHHMRPRYVDPSECPPRATVAARINLDNLQTEIVVAICHKDDDYNKKAGRAIADTRMADEDSVKAIVNPISMRDHCLCSIVINQLEPMLGRIGTQHLFLNEYGVKDTEWEGLSWGDFQNALLSEIEFIRGGKK